MQTTLAQFNEVESQNAFSLQNSKLLKVELNQVTIQAKLGSMVAYQGDVKFEHAGSGGLKRMAKKAVTGEGAQLMKISGSGEVFLAALAHSPEVIVLDEPTSGVDALARAALWDTIREQAERGAGVLVTTHYMQEAQQCDRLLLMGCMDEKHALIGKEVAEVIAEFELEFSPASAPTE